MPESAHRLRRTRILPNGAAAITEATNRLCVGGLVAFPTETVYGLGADATDGIAVARLYAAKMRPAFNPLIAHIPDLAAAQSLAVFNDAAHRLATRFWPGPVTLVLPRSPHCPVSDLATVGLDTIALRVPAHDIALEILRAFAKPVVAPSANRSGHVSPTTAAHVLADLRGRVDIVIDGGPTPVGVESTIVACINEPVILRSGAVPRDEIEQALGRKIVGPRIHLVNDEAAVAPGMMASHYAPRAWLRLNAKRVQPDEALLAFGTPLPAGAARATAILNLSPRGDLAEAAAKLFAHLRELDATDARTIAVMPIPTHGLGEALNDRLLRAAAPR